MHTGDLKLFRGMLVPSDGKDALVDDEISSNDVDVLGDDEVDRQQRQNRQT
jgi:hypothetical protein